MCGIRPLQTPSYRPSLGCCAVLTGRSLKPVSERRLSDRQMRTYGRILPIALCLMRAVPRGAACDCFSRMLRKRVSDRCVD